MSNSTHFPKIDPDHIPNKIVFTYKGKDYLLVWTNAPFYDREMPCCGNCPLCDHCDGEEVDIDVHKGEIPDDEDKTLTDEQKVYIFCCNVCEMLNDYHDEVGFTSLIDLEKFPEALKPPFYNGKLE